MLPVVVLVLLVACAGGPRIGDALGPLDDASDPPGQHWPSIGEHGPFAGKPTTPDPVGVYHLVLSSSHMVSEGTMEIAATKGSYLGRISIGTVVAVVRRVETGLGHMHVDADSDQGSLVLRLTSDGDFLAGNWVLGAQRGTVVAERERKKQEEGQALG